MQKPLQITDIAKGFRYPVAIVQTANGQAVEIHGLISDADILRLAELIMISGPINELREKFRENIAGLVEGEGPHGPMFRPAIQRQLAGTGSVFPV